MEDDRVPSHGAEKGIPHFIRNKKGEPSSSAEPCAQSTWALPGQASWFSLKPFGIELMMNSYALKPWSFLSEDIGLHSFYSSYAICAQL